MSRFSRLAKRYGSLKRTYNELYHLYGEQTFKTPDFPDVVITGAAFGAEMEKNDILSF